MKKELSKSYSSIYNNAYSERLREAQQALNEDLRSVYGIDGMRLLDVKKSMAEDIAGAYSVNLKHLIY